MKVTLSSLSRECCFNEEMALKAVAGEPNKTGKHEKHEHRAAHYNSGWTPLRPILKLFSYGLVNKAKNENSPSPPKQPNTKNTKNPSSAGQRPSETSSSVSASPYAYPGYAHPFPSYFAYIYNERIIQITLKKIEQMKVFRNLQTEYRYLMIKSTYEEAMRNRRFLLISLEQERRHFYAKQSYLMMKVQEKQQEHTREK